MSMMIILLSVHGYPSMIGRPDHVPALGESQHLLQVYGQAGGHDDVLSTGSCCSEFGETRSDDAGGITIVPAGVLHPGSSG